MQFFKAVVSTLFIAAPMLAMAAPATDSDLATRTPDDIDNLIAQLIGLGEGDAGIEARDLEARAGWTCSWLAGNKGCQVKCFILKGSGGYCDGKK